MLPLLIFVVSGHSATAQEFETQVSVISVAPPRLRVTGKRPVGTRIWSFRNAYAGLLGLAARIENFKLADTSGNDVPIRMLAFGEYESTRDATSWSYEVNLTPPSIQSDAVFVSWISDQRGFLMLGDILPRESDMAKASTQVWRVRLSLPEKWTASSTELKRSEGQYEINNVEDAVFFIGRELRERRERVGSTECIFVTEGTWAFQDQEVATMAVRILREYFSRIGVVPKSRLALMLSHYPRAAGAEKWSAETRGATVTLLSGQSPSKVAGLAQLSTPLTHELFHFWVPNGLKLVGDYAWFYEGFTTYQALCVSLRLEFLTFQDYLNTLGRAYDSYLSTIDRSRLSLVDASQRRWTGPPGLVYQKGLLVAFLYDLTLRFVTKGKHSLDNIYQTLFISPVVKGTRQDANETILSLLKNQKALAGFVQSYVQAAEEIDLKAMIAPFGLNVQSTGNRTRVVTSDKLDRRQRDLLGAFGYNSESRRVGKRNP